MGRDHIISASQKCIILLWLEAEQMNKCYKDKKAQVTYEIMENPPSDYAKTDIVNPQNRSKQARLGFNPLSNLFYSFSPE